MAAANSCPNCSAATSGDDRFCQQCGSVLTVSGPPPPPAGASARSSRRTLPLALGIGAAGLAMVALGVGTGFALSGLTQSPSSESAVLSPRAPAPTSIASAGPEEPVAEPTTAARPQPPGGAFIEVDAAALTLPGWDGVHFISPSGNLGCAITDGGTLWGCAIVEKRWAFEYDSPDDYCYESQIPCGGGIEASGGEAPHPRKRGDPGFPAATAIFNGGTDGQNPLAVLQYGQSVSYGDVTCYSESVAVTCHNHSSGHGFVIARDRNDIY